ncbi:MAG: lipoyl synthase, partial [Miltoncostaeaceae bacterium]
RVEPGPELPDRPSLVEACSQGWVPDLLVGDDHIGQTPVSLLEAVDVTAAEVAQLADRRRLPRWVIAKNPLGGGFVETKALMRDKDLVTVCEEAACPNIGKCWARGTATFMISGSQCTRGCRFCNVATGRPAGPPDPEEPARIAEAAAQMGLRFVVITAVARDDLPDGGAAHFAACIQAVRDRVPDCRVEVLIPDLRGGWGALDVIIEARPDVLNHNTETVPRLYNRVRPGARYERTLELLARSSAAGLPTKTGIMVGLGESLDEIDAVMADIAGTGCELVTVGQYLQPSPAHLPVARFYAPSEYPAIAAAGRAAGIVHVEAGALVRSSFEADRVADHALITV